MAHRRLPVAALALSLAFALAACSGADILTYIPEGGSYGADGLEALMTGIDPGKTADATIGEASELRQDALEDLRQHGTDAGLLADTLTSDFPLDEPAVPVHVELGTFEGARAWFVLEATGADDGTLGFRRLWVISFADRSVVAAVSGR